jgi:hypothetical protein
MSILIGVDLGDFTRVTKKLAVSEKSKAHKPHIWVFTDTRAKTKKSKKAVSCQN